MRKIDKFRKAHAQQIMTMFAIPTRRRYVSSDATIISYVDVAKVPAVNRGSDIQNADGTFPAMSGYDW
jgi:hypothetical protein